jgi:hypothetical protein
MCLLGDLLSFYFISNPTVVMGNSDARPATGLNSEFGGEVGVAPVLADHRERGALDRIAELRRCRR